MSSKIYYVTNSLDFGLKSLRDALTQINSEPLTQEPIVYTIIIKPETGNKITLFLELPIQKNTKILNQTRQDLIITTNTQNRIFHVYPLVSQFTIESCSENELYFQSSIFKNTTKIILSNGKADFGGAIYVSSLSSKLILKNTILKNNTATNSGGAIFTLGSVKLLNSTILKNQAGSQGGGIWSAQSLKLKYSGVSENKVTLINPTSSGGGIYIDAGDCKLQSSYVIRNQVAHDQTNNGGSAGGISVISGNIYLKNSHVDCNSAYNSGGIQLGKGNIIVTSHSTVNSNQSFNDNNTNAEAAGGGGVVISLGLVYISDSQVSNNITQGMYSGGIVTIVADVIVRRSKISGNQNRGPGGGIAVNIGSINISESQISGNTGASLGGAMVNFSPPPGVISIQESTISGNKLTNAQTIAVTIEVFLKIALSSLSQIISQGQFLSPVSNGIQGLLDSLPKILLELVKIHLSLKRLNFPVNNIVGGGAIASLLVCPVNLICCKVFGNYAGKIVSEIYTPLSSYGGAIFGYQSSVNLWSCEVIGNKSLTSGAGLWSQSSLIVEKCRIVENEICEKGESLGVGIYSSGKLYVINSEIKKNTGFMDTQGSGIENFGELVIINSRVTENTGGSGIYSTSEFVNFENCIKGNKPENIVIV
jgi:predicted outer membrane repeat protein